MPEFLITVKGTPTDSDDIRENPVGTYTYEATDEEDALDIFHADVPIAMLDDFEITVEKY